MVWSQIDVSKTHVAYAVVAVFSTLFSLCSLFVKEKLYLGEASVATIYGLIVGPHCLNWFNPLSWGNYFYITLEISRVLLCIEIVAVSVELPKKYILKHWFPVFLLLIPCMTAGWLIIGTFIYLIIPGLHFTHGLLISACITATDPILAQAVVGKGKFAKRVPAHLRNLLSAESACNDGVSIPFVYLSLNLILHAGNSKEIAKDWICVTVLYECGFGCIMGSLIGYLGRKSLRFAEDHDLIDRESFLAFYIMLALLCAGFGSILGFDDLLASFCAGTAFAWDGWFTIRTEESNVSTVIDILLNMAYFVYFGAIIPWQEFNDGSLGLNCWRLICLALVVLFLRRIPAVLVTKLVNPDIKNWKEGLFVGHFGPIGVGAIFAAIVAISDLESDVLNITHGPSTDYPTESEYYQLIRVVWPVVCFLIVTSILIHGSSVAVLTLGKQLQSMTFTMTWTKMESTNGAESSNGNWFNRLPKIERSGTSFSLKRIDTTAPKEYDEYTPSQTTSLEELPDEKRNAKLNANIGMERFGTLENIPTIGSGKPVRPAGGAKRKKNRRLLKRKQSKKRKEPPVSETLDLRNVNRHPNINESNLETEEEENQNELEEEVASQLSGTRNEKFGKEEEEEAEEAAEHIGSRLAIPLQKIVSNASANTEASNLSNNSIRSGDMRGTVHASPEALRRIASNYDLKEEDLEPVYEDGQLRIPSHAYNYKDSLVVEDQFGEIMKTVRSRSNTGVSNEASETATSKSKSRSGTLNRTGTVGKMLVSTLGSPLKHVLSNASDDNSKPENIEHRKSHASNESTAIPMPTNVEERLNPDRSNGEQNIGSKVSKESQSISPNRRVVKRSTTMDATRRTFDKFLDIGDDLLFKKSIPRKTKKLHGYRVNDDIIIENEDGEILGRYKVNVKKQKEEELAKGINDKQYNDNLIAKTLKYFGLKREREVIDEEMNQMSNTDLIPHADNDNISDFGLENKIKHFVKADPRKAVVVLPKHLTHVSHDHLRDHHHTTGANSLNKHKDSLSQKKNVEKHYSSEEEDDDDDDYDSDEYDSEDDGEDNITLDDQGNAHIRARRPSNDNAIGNRRRESRSVYDESEVEKARRKAALNKSERLSGDEEEDT